ncbi:DnaJ domain protein [Aspergillus stella-maris]|uniref:DnaJ domain protein n=1 Tax=Aspergillus stella-maris TaxID=1810926 RepID=UPI003CCE09E3
MHLHRHLRTPVSQFLFDNVLCHSHPHPALVQHDSHHPRALDFHGHGGHRLSSCGYSYAYGHRYGYGHTRKARFSTTRPHSLASAREPSLYEVLDVSVTATPAEIKKKFYALSLKHHPDRNPDDPSASQRFAKISSAYQTLSNATKRSTYDRDNGIHAYTSGNTHSTATPGQHPMGSHSSHASYFGSRPASGLSKRRGVFRGPPPSFYAHGGYGKRRPPAGAGGFSSAGAAGGAAAEDAGGSSAKGKEEDPTSFIDRNPVSHFNARGHYKTQTAEDARRQERREREREHIDINEQFIGGRGDDLIRFAIVSGMLVGTAVVTGFLRWPDGSDVKEKAKTSKDR